MTEQEKNEMAILKSKQEAEITKMRSDPAKPKTPEVTNIKIPKTPKEKEAPKKSKEYPFMVKLGKEKEIYFKPWTGKTKKKFKKIFEHIESEEDIDFTQILKVLVRDQISNSDTYLSDMEQQYLTALLRRESIGDDYTFEGECECGAKQEIKTSVTESVFYTQNNFPETINDITFKDIKTVTELQKVQEEIKSKADYDGLTSDGDIEFALHLSLGDIKNPMDILDAIDNMTLKEINTLMANFRDLSSKIDLKTTRVCSTCGRDTDYYASEIPDLFESLLQ